MKKLIFSLFIVSLFFLFSSNCFADGEGFLTVTANSSNTWGNPATGSYTLTYSDWVGTGGMANPWYVTIESNSFNLHQGEIFDIFIYKNNVLIDNFTMEFNKNHILKDYRANVGDVITIKIMYDFVTGLGSNAPSPSCIVTLNG